MLRPIISIIIQHFVHRNVQVLTLSAQLKICNNGMAWHSISIKNTPISTVALIQKHFNFCGAYFKTHIKTELK